MKKKIIVLALIVTLLCSGCGNKIPTLSNGDEAVITLKDGKMISVNELYESLKNDFALQSMVNLVDKKILEDKYSSEVESANSEADNHMSQLETAYGDKDQLLQAIQSQTTFQSLEAYRDFVYVGNLRTIAVEEYAKKQISDKEINKYYKDEVVGDIKVSHILITSKQTDSMTDDEKKAADNEAKEKAEAIIAELKKTNKNDLSDKFAELANDRSEDESTKGNGGSLGFINKDTLSDAYKQLVTEAYKLKDGEYSSKVVTTEVGYHIIYRSESKEKAELDDALKDSISSTLANEYLTKNQDAYIKSMQEIRKDYDMEIIDSELQKQYAQYIQSQLSAAQQQTQN